MALHGGLSFCKTQQVVGFDCAGIERLSVPQPNSCLLLGEPISIVMPRAELRRHTVVVLSVCHSVCLSVCYKHFSSLTEN